MAETDIITLPLLRGTLTAESPWQALLGKRSYRVYPFQLGCQVRVDSVITTIPTHGKGELEVNDYLIACSMVFYGDDFHYIPDTARITKITAIAAADDEITVAPAISVVSEEHLLCIGADGAGVPLSSPDYDGSDINLYTDNVGNNANGNAYMLTARGGRYRGWVQSGIEAVDLLVMDQVPAPVLVVPFVPTGPEIVP